MPIDNSISEFFSGVAQSAARKLDRKIMEGVMENRELDRAIAEKFLGMTNENDYEWCNGKGIRIDINEFSPSSNPLSCSLVLDEIERRGWGWEMEHYVGFDYCFTIWIDMDGDWKKYVSVSDNRYMAVCEAALQAASEEK